MRVLMTALILAAATLSAPVSAFAQSAPKQIITGEASVTVEGGQAATQGDVTSSGNVVTEGSSNVFIGGKPATVLGSSTDCGGKVVTGASSVFVNGKPLATAGSMTTGCK